MAEAIGAISGVLTITKAAIAAVEGVQRTIEEIRSAPRVASDFLNYLALFGSVLGKICASLKARESALNHRIRSASEQVPSLRISRPLMRQIEAENDHHSAISGVLGICQRDLEALLGRVRPLVDTINSNNSSGRRSRFGLRSILPVKNLSTEVSGPLRQTLDSYLPILQLSISTILLCVAPYESFTWIFFIPYSSPEKRLLIITKSAELG
jgi:hypothetical protein